MEFDDLPFLQLVVGVTLAAYCFHTYLDLRQYKAFRLDSPPKSVASLFNKDDFQKAKVYSLDKWWFGMCKGLFDIVEELAVFRFALLPWFWGIAVGISDKTGIWMESEIYHSIIFVLIISAVKMAVDLPWSLYSTFVVESRHGFNKQTPALVVGDLLKQILLGLFLIPPVVAGIVYTLLHAGAYMPLALWAFFLALGIFLMTIYPVFIAPLFNKFEILQEGNLKTKIEELASSLKFPLTKLYQMDGSKRSAHSNAYMYGFFKSKRIVLFDTLIQQCSEDQVVAVLAHELGHWKLSHTIKTFVRSQVVSLLQFILLALVRNSDGLMNSFGFKDTKPVFISLILYDFISSPLNEVIGFVMNVISRQYEFEADAFAVGLGHSEHLKQALIVMQKENRSALNVDSWYSTFHYSHPPLPERLDAIMETSKKDK